MEQCTLKNVNNYFNSNIYSYLETSGSQSYYIYLNVVAFSTPLLIGYLCQLKTVVFLHWCLIHDLLLFWNYEFQISKVNRVTLWPLDKRVKACFSVNPNSHWHKPMCFFVWLNGPRNNPGWPMGGGGGGRPLFKPVLVQTFMPKILQWTTIKLF